MVHWKHDDSWDLFSALKKRVRKLTALEPLFKQKQFSSRLERLNLRFSELYLPFAALKKRKSYDVVITWVMRASVMYGILNRLVPSDERPLHIAYDFHINTTRRDRAYRLRLFLLRLALPGIDGFMCTSEREKQLYSEMFSIPTENIYFCPIAEYYPDLIDAPGNARKDYIFSYGTSDRDFDTLVEASRATSLPVRILSKDYAPGVQLPDNIEIIRKRVPEREMIGLIAAARIVVLPMQFAEVAAGQQSMLEVMALGRPLVVTENTATAAYAKNGVDVLFCKARDAASLKHQMQRLWDNPDEAERMGARAREAFRSYPADMMNTFISILSKLVSSRDKADEG